MSSTSATPTNNRAGPRGSHKACDTCRAQKLKCIYATTDDSPDPPSCQRCQAHDLECRFDLAWRKRGPPPRDERARRDEQDLTELRNAVAQLADKDGESLAQLQASLSPDLYSRLFSRKRMRKQEQKSASPVASTSTGAPPPLPAHGSSSATTLSPLARPTGTLPLSSLPRGSSASTAAEAGPSTSAPPLPPPPPPPAPATLLPPMPAPAAASLEFLIPSDRLLRWGLSDSREQLASHALPFSLDSWPLANATSLPSPDALPYDAYAQKLIQAYWAFVHPYYAGVDRPMFERRLDSLLSLRRRAQSDPALWSTHHAVEEHHSFLALVFAVLSVAAVYFAHVEHAAAAPASSPERRHVLVADDYVSHAFAMLARDPWNRAGGRRGTLWRCQALILLSARELAVGLVHSSYNLAGSAFRLAQDAAFFIDASQTADDASGEPDAHELGEMSRRVWHGCVKLESIMSLLRGRPAMVKPREFACPLPSVDEPDEHAPWDPPHEIGHHDPLCASVKSRAVSAFDASASLAAITTQIQDELWPLTSTPSSLARRGQHQRHIDDDVYRDLTRALNDWFDALPPDLVVSDLSPGSTTPPHVIELHCQYCSTLILLYRARITSPIDPHTGAQTTGLDVVIGAARQIHDLLRFLRERHGLARASLQIMFFVYPAACVLMYQWLSGDPAGESAYTELVGWVAEYEQLLWPGSADGYMILTKAMRMMERAQLHPDWHAHGPGQGHGGQANGTGSIAVGTTLELNAEQVTGLDEVTASLIASQWWSPWFAAAGLSSAPPPPPANGDDGATAAWATQQGAAAVPQQALPQPSAQQDGAPPAAGPSSNGWYPNGST